MCVVVWSLLITSKLVDHYTDFTLLSSAFESNYMLKLHSYEITILGITQQIGTKFLHRETLDHVAWSPANLWRPPPNAAEKNSILRGFSLTLDSKTMHRFTHFPADDFREISTQNVNRCHELLRNRILKFFKKRVIYLRKSSFLWKKFGVHLRRTAAALASRPGANTIRTYKL